MNVVSESDAEMSPRGADLRDPVTRGSIVGFSLAVAACAIVVVSVVLLLVVQPSNKPAPIKQPTSLCWDSAMQMDMPCSSAP